MGQQTPTGCDGVCDLMPRGSLGGQLNIADWEHLHELVVLGKAGLLGKGGGRGVHTRTLLQEGVLCYTIHCQLWGFGVTIRWGEHDEEKGTCIAMEVLV